MNTNTSTMICLAAPTLLLWVFVTALLLSWCTTADPLLDNPSININVNIKDLEDVLSNASGPNACMSIWQLKDAVTAAAKPIATGQSLKAVFMTSAEYSSMKVLLEPFLTGLTRASSDSLTHQLIVISFGIPAFLFCDSLRSKYGHQCVLDKMCLDGQDYGTERIQYMSKGFMMACFTRTLWAYEILKLGFAVQHLDMDIVVFKDPLLFYQTNLPDADFAISSEAMTRCDHCLNDASLLVEQWLPREREAFRPNTGVFFAKPTDMGKGLLQVWLERMHYDFMILGKFNHFKDQEFLGNMFRRMHDANSANITQPVTRVVNGTREIVEFLHVNFNQLKMYKLHPRNFRSNCGGICGTDCKIHHTHKNHTSSAGLRSIRCPYHQQEFLQIYTWHSNCETNNAVKQHLMLQYIDGIVTATPDGDAVWW